MTPVQNVFGLFVFVLLLFLKNICNLKKEILLWGNTYEETNDIESWGTLLLIPRYFIFRIIGL